MAKYSYELKLNVVEAYISGIGGYSYIAKLFGISTKSLVKQWVNTYKTFGKEGLKRNTKDTNYPVQFKLNVLEYMLRTEESYQTTANHFMIHNPAMLCDWKKKYETGGVEALSKTKGRPPMKKEFKEQKNKLTKEQRLEEENEHLRAELAFIKKLRALGMNIPERLLTKDKQE